MFFATQALLLKKNKKITGDLGIHRLTYHALVVFFYNKFTQQFINNYKEAIDDCEELLQICENKSNELFLNYSYETKKRKQFTYEMGANAETSKAKTSLSRAQEFLLIVEDMYDSI